MKNITFKLLLVTFIVTSITSCYTYKDVVYKYDTSPICNLEEGQVKYGNIETELEMIGEVTASYTISNKDINSKKLDESKTYIVDDDFLYRIKSDKTVKLYQQAKSRVLHMALEKAGCDVIFAPIYKLEVKGKEIIHPNGTNMGLSSSPYHEATYTITVKGYGANIKGVKQIKSN